MDIDIFNDNYEYMGVVNKKLAHQLGLWHRVYNGKIKLKTYPFKRVINPI